MAGNNQRHSPGPRSISDREGSAGFLIEAALAGCRKRDARGRARYWLW